MKNKLSLLLLISLFIVGNANAQKKKQSKKVLFKALVVDSENNPIRNASIFIDGTKSAVTSGADGRFQVKLKRTVKNITVFTLFNGAAELEYKGEETHIFVLSPGDTEEETASKTDKDESELVNSGYENDDKRRISNSAVEVDKKHLKSERHYNTIYDMIKGEVPGVDVRGSSVIIRGISSFSSYNQPLYVVNGSPTNSISNISPDNVKSISILKGGAASIYGSRGMNGVILITLKTAKDK